jgi:NADH-quinone oxidoreductase subunit G
MLENPRKGYLLWDFEPDFDVSSPALAQVALQSAEKVVAVCSFATAHLEELADVNLPLAPLAESEGMLHRLDGQAVQLRPAGNVSGQCKPGWKILRRLGEQLALEGFAQVSLQDLQKEMEALLTGEASIAGLPELSAEKLKKGLFRVGEVPMYSLDALCRRSDALQQTIHAQTAFVGVNHADAQALKIEDGSLVSVDQGGEKIELQVRVSDDVPQGAAWIYSATGNSSHLGDSFGPVSIKPVLAKGASS